MRMKNLKLSLATLAVTAVLPWASPAFSAEAGANLDLARQLNQAFVEVAETVSASVVVINVVQKASLPSLDDVEDDGSFDSLPPGFWRRFHEQFKQQVPEKTRGLGSGIIFRE